MWYEKTGKPICTAIIVLLLMDYFSFLYIALLNIFFDLIHNIAGKVHHIPFIGEYVDYGRHILRTTLRPYFIQILVGYVSCYAALKTTKEDYKQFSYSAVFVSILTVYVIYCFWFKHYSTAICNVGGCSVCIGLLLLLMYIRKLKSENKITVPPTMLK